MKAFQSLLIIFCLVFLAACTKEGPIGPKGDKGDTGAQGQQGATGAQGPAGQNGQNGQDANVTGKNFVVYSTQWYHAGTNGDTDDRYVADLSVPAITQNVMDYGMVMVYYSWNDVHYFPLPVTMYKSSNYQSFYTYYSIVGGVQIQRYDSDYNTISESTDMYVKVVAVNGHGKAAHPNLNWSDYEEVKSALELKD